jgi:hemerythrin
VTPPPADNQSQHALCAALRRARKTLCTQVATTAAAQDDDFIDEFPALVTAVEASLRREELVMELLGFANLPERREENATILAALHRVTPAVEGGNVALGREVLDALGAVLDLHRLTADLALALVAHGHADDVVARVALAARPAALHRRHVV